MATATRPVTRGYDRIRLPPRTREDIFVVARKGKMRRVFIAMPTAMYAEAKEQALLRGVSVYSIFQIIGADRLIDRIEERMAGVPEDEWSRYILYLPKDAEEPSPAPGCP